MGRPLDIVLFIIIIIIIIIILFLFFPPKVDFTPWCLSRNFTNHCIGHLERSFDFTHRTWPLTPSGVTRHFAKKHCYQIFSKANETIGMKLFLALLAKIGKWKFLQGLVLRDPLRQLLPLTGYKFYIKIQNSQPISRRETKPTAMLPVTFDLEKRSRTKVKVKGQGQSHLHPLIFKNMKIYSFMKMELSNS